MSTLCDPMDCSLPGSSVHGILQARILEWVAIPFSRGSSQSRDQTQVSCIAGRASPIKQECWKDGAGTPWSPVNHDGRCCFLFFCHLLSSSPQETRVSQTLVIHVMFDTSE